MENAFLAILLQHFVVVFHFTVLAWRIHAVTMWRLKLLPMHVRQALLAPVAVQNLALDIISRNNFVLLSNLSVVNFR